ncbi:general substrate transporter [Penicillium longicatenatum]|uniref:general substrate transporter n=1 Tax=Penicillium longicatenatum TaxID=1561947 RepID=UPI0025498CF6|nr:general substrate transporter [Penicillium longicatenatum]KAJ5630285.1 general substrate transporter [Penicillium longicatenatum]
MGRLNGTKLGAFRAYFLGFFICLAGFLFGYDTGIVGGILEFPSYMDDFGYTDETTVDAVMVSLQNVGAFFAALAIFPISERFGRKKTIQTSMAIFCVGVILQVVPSHSLVCFYIGRVVSGVGLGGATAVVPTYSAEMAPKEIRGMLGSGVQWLFALGVMTSYWIDYAVEQTLAGQSKEWQIPVGLQLVPSSILALGLFTQPESCRWLAKKGRMEEAWQSLAWMRADDGPAVKAEFNEIKIALAALMFCGQQCTGMTALAYYGPQFFKIIVGDDSSRSLLVTGLFGAEKFVTVGTYILFFSEMWGRKPTLWIGNLLMACCFITVVAVNKTTDSLDAEGNPSSAGIATVFMIFLSNSIYQFSWGPIPWPYTTEIFPSRIREIGSSVAVSSQWLFNFLFSLTTPYMISAWGTYTFIFYAGLDIIMAISVFLFVKETRGKSLEEMESIFHSAAAFDVEIARHEGLAIQDENLSALEVHENLKSPDTKKSQDSSD